MAGMRIKMFQAMTRIANLGQRSSKWWRWKLTMLLRNKDEQEGVSSERKDRRDFEQLQHCRQYAKVVVFSKVPQPNYRSDLDDQRPQREVILPFGLLREVDVHLKAYLSKKYINQARFSDKSLSSLSTSGTSTTDEGLYEQQEPLAQNSIVREKILRRRSFQLREKQQHWQESPEGQKMLEFRSGLPAYSIQ